MSNHVNQDYGINGIVGVDEAEASHPVTYYTVAVYLDGTWQCTGSILDSIHVVTAAHCFFYKDDGSLKTNNVEIVAGVRNLKLKNKITIGAEKISIPRDFMITLHRKPRDGDIAVLKLLRPLDLEGNPNLATVKLPSTKQSYEGQWGVVSGFGDNLVDFEYDEYNFEWNENTRFDGKLRYVEALVATNDYCTGSVKHLCAQSKQNDKYHYTGLCSGDSGGPLVVDTDTLIATVVNSPVGCDERNELSLYTNVSTYLNFLLKAQRDQRGKKILTYTLV